MSEEQRELSEEELRDGIPVDPPPDEETETEIVEVHPGELTSAPSDPPAPVEIPNPIERPVMTLNPHKLIEWGYVVNVPFGGKMQPILTVDGIRHISQTMGIRLLNCDVRESEDGEWFYGEAEAHDPSTGATWFGKVRQAAKFKNGKSDPQAWEKCNTRAQRNALKGLIPYQRLVNACAQLMRAG